LLRDRLIAVTRSARLPVRAFCKAPPRRARH
jgi:hypothetical protein